MSKDTKKVTLTEEQLEELKAATATQGGGTVRLPVVDRIIFNGNADAVENEKGELVRPDISYFRQVFKGKSADERPEKESIGAPIEAIFVKSRRRLVARDSQGFQTMSTSQHEHPNQTVTLWENGKCIARGAAKALREKYEDLRTVQETYVLYNGELMLLINKGAALGSETRDDKYPTFYQHLQSLKDDGIFGHVTILNGVLEKGVKQFYTPTFEVGRPTTPEEQLEVLTHVRDLNALFAEYDEEQKTMSVGSDVEVETETETETAEETETLF